MGSKEQAAGGGQDRRQEGDICTEHVVTVAGRGAVNPDQGRGEALRWLRLGKTLRQVLYRGGLLPLQIVGNYMEGPQEGRVGGTTRDSISTSFAFTAEKYPTVTP